jgi:hypothetical protein
LNSRESGTVAESLRSGIPVLASNRGGVPEIVSKPELVMLYNPEEAKSRKNALSSIKKALLAGRYDPVITLRMLRCTRRESINDTTHSMK